LTSCTVPAKGTPTFQLEEDEIEFGVGIHGEPGVRREKTSSADELAKKMVNDILADMKIEDSNEEEIALMINGFGGT
ncbi:dihydroxyacetone kinase subunit DhaK, partial [Alistipes putredinis]|nr:dihydroxyacetone kinase subunit DhaK [Alistipes putredinis]